MPALDISISHEGARTFALEAYLPFQEPDRDPSHPLSDCAADKVLDVCSREFWPSSPKPERVDVKGRHQCGFYVFICLTALTEPVAFSELYFYAAFQHLGSNQYSRPDKGVVKAGLRSGHLEFIEQGGRLGFRLTEEGRHSYMEWLHAYSLRNFSAPVMRNFPNLQSWLYRDVP